MNIKMNFLIYKKNWKNTKMSFFKKNKVNYKYRNS